LSLSQRHEWLDANPSSRYILPFALFFVFLWLSDLVPLRPAWEAPIRVLCLGTVCFLCWPPALPVKPAAPLQSVLIGAAVFALWIAPDLIIKNYRQLAPFNNGLVGHIHSSLSAQSVAIPWILAWRSVRAVVIVPIVEELFWRAWMMRWLIDSSFERIPLGTFQLSSFLIVAVLFAAEHGPYWDVGLVTGLIYNWWMVHTKSVSDCILMHAVTNACLSAYVIWGGHWEYWQ
jgi:uncharacterized protein